MPKTEKPKPPDDAEQSARFLTTAKEREANENNGAFEAAMRVFTPLNNL
jgi:hypothetical protein